MLRSLCKLFTVFHVRNLGRLLKEVSVRVVYRNQNYVYSELSVNHKQTNNHIEVLNDDSACVLLMQWYSGLHSDNVCGNWNCLWDS